MYSLKFTTNASTFPVNDFLAMRKRHISVKTFLSMTYYIPKTVHNEINVGIHFVSPRKLFVKLRNNFLICIWGNVFPNILTKFFLSALC